MSIGALRGAGDTVPLTDRLSLAGIGGETSARLGAGTRDGVPSTRVVEVAGFLSEVGILALLLAELSSGDPAAARLSSAGSLALDETAGLLADSLLTVPLAVGVVDATSGSRVLVHAVDFADVQLPHAHGFTDASVLDLASSVGGHAHGVVEVADAAALLGGSVPHAVVISIASNGSGVFDTAGCEAASTTKSGVDEEAARVGIAVGRSGGDGDGFASSDALATDPGAVGVAAALTLSADLSTVSLADSIDPLAVGLRAAGSGVSGVLAASEALALSAVPFAEFRISVAGTGGDALSAGLDTLASDGVDGAAGVLLAVSEVGSVLSRAALLASSVLQAALSGGIADGSGLAGALRRAVGGGGVPVADGGASSAGGGIAAGAGGLALALSVVTGGSGIALFLGLDDSAVGAASSGVDVPLALRVTVAGRLGAVLVLALGDAAATGDLALRLSQAVRCGAHLTRGNASVGGRREHALIVIITLNGGTVANKAVLLAGHGAGAKSGFGPDAVTVRSAVALSGASRAGALAGGGSSLPHAHRGGIAGSLSADGRAGSGAHTGGGVPHAESIGDALHLSGVDVLALATASVVGAPDAHGDGFTITTTIDASTVLTAHTGVLVPDAASISGAIFRVGVE